MSASRANNIGLVFIILVCVISHKVLGGNGGGGGGMPCDSGPCKNGGTCQNDMSGYTCICPPGITGTNCNDSAALTSGFFTVLFCVVVAFVEKIC